MRLAFGERAGSSPAMTPTALSRRLTAEFAALYLVAPLLMALALPPDWLWPAFLGLTLLTAVLLARTPGFRWRELLRGRPDAGRVAAAGVATAVACGALVLWLLPERALALPRQEPALWLAILALYPFLSALPQELVFRALFFRRYGGLFADRRLAVGLNAAAFALAHLMFWNGPALVLSFAGGVIFALGYLGRGGFPMAVLLHAVCGGILFTSGLGTFFYHGAVALR